MTEAAKAHVVAWTIEPGKPGVSVATCSCGLRNIALRSPRTIRWQRFVMQSHVSAAAEEPANA